MNSATRDQIIAAKERLQQLTEEAREAEKRKVSKEYWEKTQAEERAQEAASMIYHQRQAEHLAQKEKLRVEAKAREDERHLRLHNKTVRQVLSQVAKTSRQGKVTDDEEDDGDSDDGSSDDESGTETNQNGQQQKQDRKEMGKNVTDEIEQWEGQATSRTQPSRKYQKHDYPTFFISLFPRLYKIGSLRRRDNTSPSGEWQP